MFPGSVNLPPPRRLLSDCVHNTGDEPELRLNPGLPVVYVSGHDGHEWNVRVVPQSVLITKPFAPMQISVAISSLLNTTDPQS